MIRLWLSREHAIPIREQLTTQLLFGIVSKRLAPGERLPSVRELARRLQIHSNTVSAAYRDLAGRGWVTNRKGSGVYVRDEDLPQYQEGIEGFVRAWVETARAQGFKIEDLEATLARIGHEPPAKKLLVVDLDPDLARILALEIADVLEGSVSSASLSAARSLLTPDTCVLHLPTHAERIIAELNPASHSTINLKSMEDLVAGRTRPPALGMIAIVSRSESIRRWGATLLSALGFSSEAILLRNPNNPQWKRGLSTSEFVVADVEAIQELPRRVADGASLLRIVAPKCFDELRVTLSRP